MPELQRAEWVDAMRGVRVIAVAKALGHQARPPRGASPGAIVGCPACTAELRHPKRGDRRGAVGLHQSGLGWRCFQCEAAGDAIDFVAFKLRGSRYRDLADHARAEVQRWCADFTNTSSVASADRWDDTAPEPPRDPIYPPAEQVIDLWHACVRADEDLTVASYLRGRALSATRIADLDLARALPCGVDVPEWARGWQHSGHRLIVPMRDASATMRSVLARAIAPAERKSLAPRGFQRSGLAMMCPFAQALVQSGAYPEWWPRDRDLRVIVSEGEPDFLTWVTEFTESAECAPATIGVVEGSWSAELASRIADRAVVLIATHCDDAGNKYAERVVRSFERRQVQLERWSAEASL